MQQYSDSSTFEFIAQIPIEALLLIVEDLLVADYFFEKKQNNCASSNMRKIPISATCINLPCLQLVLPAAIPGLPPASARPPIPQFQNESKELVPKTSYPLVN